MLAAVRAAMREAVLAAVRVAMREAVLAAVRAAMREAVRAAMREAVLAAVRAAMREAVRAAVRAAVRRCRCCASLWCLGISSVHSAVRPCCLACCLISCFVLIIFSLLVFAAYASSLKSAGCEPRLATQPSPPNFTDKLCTYVSRGSGVGERLKHRRQQVFGRCVEICC